MFFNRRKSCYAKGNNFGLSKVQSKYALILNPDAIENNTIKNFLITKKINDFAILGPAKQDEFSNEENNKIANKVFQVNRLKGFNIF